ncbi:MAG: SDR family NAD(P)-dependent oxidoreductase [Paludibacteraceae bacterium]
MKKAIVIGASSGMGRELSRILAQNNYIVGITARRENLLNELYNENPESYIVQPFDISETDTIKKNLDKLADRLGDLDLVIISAGSGKLNLDFDYKTELATTAVNVTAFTVICNWAMYIFREQKRGHLVAITSVAGARGWRNNPAYNAAKAYQINYLEGLRNHAAHLKLPITVTNIMPGYVETRMKGRTFVFWVAPVEVAAKQIYKSIRKKRKIAYTYRRWRFIYFLLKHIPNKLIETGK